MLKHEGSHETNTAISTYILWEAYRH